MKLKVLFLAAAVAAGVGCADLSKYLKQGTDLVGSLLPQVNGLLESGKGLTDRVQKIPAQFPGASDLLGKLTSNQTSLESLKNDITGYPAKLEEATKSGNEDTVTKLLSEQKESGTAGIAAATARMTGLGTEVKGLEAQHAAAQAAPPKPVAPATYSKALASGFSLTGNLTGIEAQLVAFIEDASKSVDKTTWFDFDRLTFKTGSADLDAEKSKEQLVNVAEILKAYPKVKLKVGGYTDNQGAAAANLKLSAQRATNVSKAITGLGPKADRLSAEGFGAAFPVCAANDTDACRAQNRRISVRVTAK
jgi:outer membrane protein OmpA-like peptidoglycan-associated protein